MEAVKIDREKYKFVIKFNSNIYSKKCIELALKDFKNFGCGRLEILGEEILVDFDVNKSHAGFLNDTAYEFCNYVLGLMKNKFYV